MEKIKIITGLIIIFILEILLNACSESYNETKTKTTQDSIRIINTVKYGDTLSFLWETPLELKTPESVKYDSEKQILYVANINGNPTDKDGNGFISQVSLEGNILKKEWVKNLNAPKGMGIFKDNLYVSDIDQLIVISIKTGKVIQKYHANNAKFLNDVDVDETGNVYVSDMSSNRIFRLKGSDFSVWCESPEFIKPNGLYVDNENLLVGVKNKILSVNINSKEIKTLINNTGNIDGLELIENNQLIFSDWSGHINISKPDGGIKRILDTVKDTIQAADIEYCAEKDMVLVPTFYHNTISAYKIIRK